MPFPEVDRQVHERRDREAAGRFAGTAGSAGNHHPVALLVEIAGDAVFREAGYERLVLPADAQDQVVIVVGEPERTAPGPRPERRLDGNGRRWRVGRPAERRQCEPPRQVTVVVVGHGSVSAIDATVTSIATVSSALWMMRSRRPLRRECYGVLSR